MKARDDEYMVPLTPEQAREGRDAFGKSLYDGLFKWLTERINEATEQKGTEKENIGKIGLLDIFGFESFKVNR